VKVLESAGLLSGVFDDRGRYVSLTADELDTAAAWVRARGRVTAPALAAASGSLFDLQPRSVETEPEPEPEPDAGGASRAAAEQRVAARLRRAAEAGAGGEAGADAGATT
jgi:hypothetical protein